MRLSDREVVRREYATEPGLRRVERRDVESPVTFPDAAAVRGYIASSVAHKHLATLVPELDGPLVATRRNAVFVADK